MSYKRCYLCARDFDKLPNFERHMANKHTPADKFKNSIIQERNKKTDSNGREPTQKSSNGAAFNANNDDTIDWYGSFPSFDGDNGFESVEENVVEAPLIQGVFDMGYESDVEESIPVQRVRGGFETKRVTRSKANASSHLTHSSKGGSLSEEGPMDMASALSYLLGETSAKGTDTTTPTGIMAEDDSGQTGNSPVSQEFMQELPIEGANMRFGMYDLMIKRKQSGYEEGELTTKELYQLKLIQMCIDAKVPNYLCDEIFQWAEEAYQHGYFSDNNAQYKRRDKLVRSLSKWVGLDCAAPMKSVVALKHAGINLPIIYFDAQQAIFSLLNDKELMVKENLSFLSDMEGDQTDSISPDFIFDKPPALDGSHLPANYVFGDINTGTLAQVVHHERLKIRGREAFVPVIFFIDKTHIDRHGRLCQEPICFTLGIFNQATRANPRAWRILGYIPNQSMHITAKTPVDKLRDYHSVISHIFTASGLTEMMNGPGHYWRFSERATGGKREGLLHFYFSFLTGDTSGHNQACGHYNAGTHNVPCLCRMCDTPYQETDNPHYRFCYNKRSDIVNGNCPSNEERRDGNLYCNKIGFHFLGNNNAFDLLDFGVGDNERSHVSHRTPYDIQHSVRTGNISRTINAFRSLERKKRAKKRKASAKEKISKEMQLEIDALNTDVNVEDTYPIVLVQTDQHGNDSTQLVVGDAPQTTAKKNYIFSRIPKSVAEKAMLMWGNLLSHQSCKGLPRTYFPQGALSTEKLNCHEYPGLLLLYSLFLVSTIGTQFLGSKDKVKERNEFKRHAWLGDKNIMQWTRVLERQLLNDAFIHSKRMTREQVDLYGWYMPYYLQKIKDVVNRTEKAGMKYVKFHSPLHTADSIIMYGVPQNDDTEIGEKNHIEFSKKTGRRTQLRSAKLDHQSGRRYHENLIVSNAALRFLPKKLKQTKLSRGSTAKPVPRGRTLCFGKEGIFENPGKKKIQGRIAVQSKDEDNKVRYCLALCNPKNSQSSSDGSSTSDSAESDADQSPPRKRALVQRTLVPASFKDNQGKTSSDPGPSLQSMLQTFLSNEVAPNCHGLLSLVNEIELSGITYRASPARASQRGHATGWNDWAYAHWTPQVIPREYITKSKDGARSKKTNSCKNNNQIDDGTAPTGSKLGEAYLNQYSRLAPVHLLCFVELVGLRSPFQIHGHAIEREGLYAVCHAVTQLPPQPVSGSVLFHWAIKDVKKDDMADSSTDRNMLLYMIPVNCIKKPCICVPDMAGPRRKNRNTNDRSWTDCEPRRATNILIAPLEDWPSLFVEVMTDKHKRVTDKNGENSDDELGSEDEQTQPKSKSNGTNHRK